jgi:asparagine synthase (glutamine-hydrolysing)
MPDAALLGRMADLLAHRGPDDQGSFAENNVALAFRRLSILDLAPSGHQPMLSPDGRHVIVFNGEIYNFVELRAELLGLGHVFRSTGDTEVLLAAYRQWGVECLQRLNGMWAFLIYDRIERRLFGARDRFGVKPLYRYRGPRCLMFASEIKAIRDSGAMQAAPNWRSIAQLLLDSKLDASEQTFYEGIEQVAAGTAFETDADGNMRSWRYWSLPAAVAASTEPADPVEAYRLLFEDAVRLRMRSDVPVGVQLSGGLDSTSIIASMARQLRPAGQADQLHAFCYMAEQFDETPQIRATLQQTGAHLVTLDSNPAAMWDAVRRHLWYQDEPVHSFTSVVGFKLMELAKSHNVKVLLNGQGADEVLAGYSSYLMEYWTEMLHTGCWWAAANAIRQFAASNGKSSLGLGTTVLRKWTGGLLHSIPGYAALVAARRRARVNSSAWVSQEVKRCWVAPVPERCNDLNDALRASVEASPLPLYLRVEDRNSMAHSIEVRLPFLDYRLVTLAFRLDAHWKLDGPYTKRLLRDAMRGQIPEIVRTQLRKLGFPTPIDHWFRDALYEPLRDVLGSRVVRESGLWNIATVDRALEQHRRGEAQLGNQLFDVAQLCLWMSSAWHTPH